MKRKPIVTGTLTFALLGVVPPTFAAGRACVDNFAQSNQTSQKFQSFVEITSDSNKALIALGRAFAADGFLGVSANKDLGIVSGYFETNLKKSTVNGTVTEAPAGKVKVELAIQLNQDLRASNAAMLDAICRLLEATMSDDEKKLQVADKSNSVLMKSATGEANLNVMIGNLRKAGFAFVLLLYMDFQGPTAAERTKDSQPTFIVPTKDDPSKSYFLVKLESDNSKDGIRSLKVGNASSLISGAVTGKMDLNPDSDWTRPFSSKLIGEGKWSVVPKDALPPGEYGLWDGPNMALIPFGVD